VYNVSYFEPLIQSIPLAQASIKSIVKSQAFKDTGNETPIDSPLEIIAVKLLYVEINMNKKEEIKNV